MVTIKIQSINDIVAAYLKTLGFSDAQVGVAVPKVLKLMKTELTSGDEIINDLDKLILATAKKVFGKTKYANEQLIALFKACYLLNNGATVWGETIFWEDKLPKNLVEKIQTTNLHQAPDYAFSKMEVQLIETNVPDKLFSRIVNLFRKA